MAKKKCLEMGNKRKFDAIADPHLILERAVFVHAREVKGFIVLVFSDSGNDQVRAA